MVFRAVVSGLSTANHRWRTLLAAVNRGPATSTAPRSSSKAYSTTISGLLHDSPRRRKEGEFVPVYVSLGLIALSVSLGLFAAKQQLLYSPNVYVSKRRREMFPEVYDPDWAAAEADRFRSRSIFRRVAHLQDLDDRVRAAGVSDDPARPGSRLHHPGRVEDLRTVGILDPHSSH